MTDRTDSMNVGRRAFLGAGAAFTVAALTGTAAVALQPDPVLAAIEAHKAARVVVYSTIDAVTAREKELASEGKRNSRDRAGDKQLEECEAALRRAFDAEEDAACALLGGPATMAGVIALLQYAHTADTDGQGWPSDLQSDDGKHTGSWQYFLIEMLASNLPALVRV